MILYRQHFMGTVTQEEPAPLYTGSTEGGCGAGLDLPVRVIFEIRISQQQCLECYRGPPGAGFPVSQSVSYFTVPPRAHPSTGFPTPVCRFFSFLGGDA